MSTPAIHWRSGSLATVTAMLPAFRCGGPVRVPMTRAGPARDNGARRRSDGPLIDDDPDSLPALRRSAEEARPPVSRAGSVLRYQGRRLALRQHRLEDRPAPAEAHE